MKYKLKNGVEVELHEDDMKAIADMYSKESEFDGEKLLKYFHDMWSKAKLNLSMISEEDVDSENDIKNALAKVLHYGTAAEISNFIIEAIEMQTAYNIIESMK